MKKNKSTAQAANSYLEDHELSLRMSHLEASLIELSMVTNSSWEEYPDVFRDGMALAVMDVCIAHANFVNQTLENAHLKFKTKELQEAHEAAYSILYSLDSLKVSPMADNYKHLYIHGLCYIAKDLQEKAFK